MQTSCQGPSLAHGLPGRVAGAWREGKGGMRRSGELDSTSRRALVSEFRNSLSTA